MSPSAKLQFPHWFYFHIILTFQLMLLFFSPPRGYWDCIVILKACTYCVLHVLHTLLNTIEVYLVYFSQEPYLCPFYRWGDWGTWSKDYQIILRAHQKSPRRLVNIDSGPHPQVFWFRRAEIWPENLPFSQVPRGSWFWFRKHLRASEMGQVAPSHTASQY